MSTNFNLHRTLISASRSVTWESHTIFGVLQQMNEYPSKNLWKLVDHNKYCTRVHSCMSNLLPIQRSQKSEHLDHYNPSQNVPQYQLCPIELPDKFLKQITSQKGLTAHAHEVIEHRTGHPSYASLIWELSRSGYSAAWNSMYVGSRDPSFHQNFSFQRPGSRSEV